MVSTFLQIIEYDIRIVTNSEKRNITTEVLAKVIKLS